MRWGKIPVAMQQADELRALHCGKNRTCARPIPLPKIWTRIHRPATRFSSGVAYLRCVAFGNSPRPQADKLGGCHELAEQKISENHRAYFHRTYRRVAGVDRKRRNGC